MLYYLSVTVWNEYKRCQPGIPSFQFKAEAAKMLRKQQTIFKKITTGNQDQANYHWWKNASFYINVFISIIMLNMVKWTKFVMKPTEVYKSAPTSVSLNSQR